MKSLSKKEFELIHQTGKPYYTKDIKAKILQANETKWGFIVSGKHGSAVVRNTIRRRFKAVAADIEKKLSTAALILIMPRVGIAGTREISEQMGDLARKAGIVS